MVIHVGSQSAKSGGKNLTSQQQQEQEQRRQQQAQLKLQQQQQHREQLAQQRLLQQQQLQHMQQLQQQQELQLQWLRMQQQQLPIQGQAVPINITSGQALIQQQHWWSGAVLWQPPLAISQGLLHTLLHLELYGPQPESASWNVPWRPQFLAVAGQDQTGRLQSVLNAPAVSSQQLIKFKFRGYSTLAGESILAPIVKQVFLICKAVSTNAAVDPGKIPAVEILHKHCDPHLRVLLVPTAMNRARHPQDGGEMVLMEGFGRVVPQGQILLP